MRTTSRFGAAASSGIAVAFLCCLSTEVHAYEWHSDRWWGYEIWDTEVCQIKTQTVADILFVAQKNWEGRFWIGLERPNHGLIQSSKISGAITFDDYPTLLLEGSVTGPFILFEDTDKRKALENQIGSGKELRIATPGASVIISLAGSSKAKSWLAQCAERVWPGAGDEDDSGAIRQ